MNSLALVLLLPLVAVAQAPDAADILRHSDEARKTNGTKAELYAYREYVVRTELDKNGEEESRRTETWDVIGLEGAPYRKLILRDEKPLKAKEQKTEDKRLVEETKKRQREKKQPKNRVLSLSYNLSFGPQSMHLFDTSYLGDETVNGRPAYLIEGIPKPMARPTNDNEKELLHYRVKWWIDKEDFNDARLELEVISPGSRMQQGSSVSILMRPLDDGVWVMSEMRFDFNLRFFKVAGGRGTVLTTRSDFHKFEVTSRVVDAPQ